MISGIDRVIRLVGGWRTMTRFAAAGQFTIYWVHYSFFIFCFRQSRDPLSEAFVCKFTN